MRVSLFSSPLVFHSQGPIFGSTQESPRATIVRRRAREIRFLDPRILLKQGWVGRSSGFRPACARIIPRRVRSCGPDGKLGQAPGRSGIGQVAKEAQSLALEGGGTPRGERVVLIHRSLSQDI